MIIQFTARITHSHAGWNANVRIVGHRRSLGYIFFGTPFTISITFKATESGFLLNLAEFRILLGTVPTFHSGIITWKLA